jgi:transcriptional regulator with XRE-family HTH domain
MSTDALRPRLLLAVTSLTSNAQALGPFWKSATVLGTGGFATPEYYLLRSQFPGYLVLPVTRAPGPESNLPIPIVARMQLLRSAFGRNFSLLPAVFGVSRQTLDNWLQGEQPKIADRARIEALAEAAQVFLACDYTPSHSDLGRTLLNGKSLIELISQGENGRDLAEELMQLVYRGMESRKKLDAMLAETSAPRFTPADFGSPALDENSE